VPETVHEHLYSSLDEAEPELANALKRRYAKRWLKAARLPEARFQDALESVELMLSPAGKDGKCQLRVRSSFTGTTYWLDGWDGSTATGERLVDAAADLQGANVRDEREDGPTPWD
jgi:hypothetical protein